MRRDDDDYRDDPRDRNGARGRSSHNSPGWGDEELDAYGFRKPRRASSNGAAPQRTRDPLNPPPREDARASEPRRTIWEEGDPRNDDRRQAEREAYRSEPPRREARESYDRREVRESYDRRDDYRDRHTQPDAYRASSADDALDESDIEAEFSRLERRASRIDAEPAAGLIVHPAAPAAEPVRERPAKRRKGGLFGAIVRALLLGALGFSLILTAGGLASAAAFSAPAPTDRAAQVVYGFPAVFMDAPADTVRFVARWGSAWLEQWRAAVIFVLAMAAALGFASRLRGRQMGFLYWSLAWMNALAVGGAGAVLVLLAADYGVDNYVLSSDDQIAIAAVAGISAVILIFAARLARIGATYRRPQGVVLEEVREEPPRAREPVRRASDRRERTDRRRAPEPAPPPRRRDEYDDRHERARAASRDERPAPRNGRDYEPREEAYEPRREPRADDRRYDEPRRARPTSSDDERLYASNGRERREARADDRYERDYERERPLSLREAPRSEPPRQEPSREDDRRLARREREERPRAQRREEPAPPQNEPRRRRRREQRPEIEPQVHVASWDDFLDNAARPMAPPVEPVGGNRGRRSPSGDDH